MHVRQPARWTDRRAPVSRPRGACWATLRPRSEAPSHRCRLRRRRVSAASSSTSGDVSIERKYARASGFGGGTTPGRTLRDICRNARASAGDANPCFRAAAHARLRRRTSSDRLVSRSSSRPSSSRVEFESDRSALISSSKRPRCLASSAISTATIASHASSRPRGEVISANVAGGRIAGCARFDPLAVGRLVGCDRRDIEHARVMREAGDQLLERHLRELLRREIGAGVHQDFDPDAKARRVELFVEPGPCGRHRSRSKTCESCAGVACATSSAQSSSL